MSAAPILTFLKDGEVVRSLSVEDEAVLGRAEGCVIRLEDRAISRHHAVFRRTKEGLQVERKSEFAPLSVNGAECTRALVKEGDVIAIGPYLARVSLPQPEPARAAAPAVPAVPAAQTLQAVHAVQGTRPTPEPAPVGLALGEVDLPGAQATMPIEIPQAAPLEPVADASGGGGFGSAPDPFASSDALPATSLLAASGGVAPAGLTASSEVVMDSGDAGGALRLPSDEGATRAEMADDDAATKLNAPTKLAVRLAIKAGSATDASGAAITELELEKDETYLGRGKDCDLVLNDKKSSRKNSVIRRAGLSFSIKDLDSSNGTYVNGSRLSGGKERELLDGDVVRIGGVEIGFHVLSRDYLARAANLASLPSHDDEADAGPSSEEQQVIAQLDGISLASGGLRPTTDPGFGQLDGGSKKIQLFDAGAGLDAPGVELAGGIAGIAGIDPAASTGGQQSLVAKFRALPKPRQYLIVGLIIAILFLAFGMEEEVAPPPVKKPKAAQGEGKPKAVAPATLESLSPEQRKFVEERYNQALAFFGNKDFDQAIAALEQVLKTLPTYEPARELDRYAREGKRKLEAQLEEQRKREDEAKLKAKVQQLVDEAGARMAAKDYVVARELFGQILALDPDNAAVNGWRKEIEAYEERVKLEQQQKDVEAQINQRAREIFDEGMALKKQGKYYGAIELFGKVKDIGASDAKLLRRAQAQIKASRSAIAARRQPLLDAAKAAEDAGELAKALEHYRKAVAADPNHQPSYAAISRLKAAIHERAKAPYTEAVLAESYSDFATAQRKYQETIAITPEDDEYHQRAKRRLRFYIHRGDPASGGEHAQ